MHPEEQPSKSFQGSLLAREECLDGFVRSTMVGLMAESKQIQLKLDHGAHLNFRWQMYFNRFSVEHVSNGRVVSLASTYEGSASEIVPIFISNEGLTQLAESAKHYLSGFSDLPDAPPESERLPLNARRFSPMFSNHVRLARSGGSAEVLFYTMPLTLIIDEIQGRRKQGHEMPLIPVAIFHSEVSVHYRLVVRLLDGVEAPTN